MTPEEIQAVAARIADRVAARRDWVPAPVRPEPPGRPSSGQLPAWAGAAQSLSDVAPVPGRKTPSGRHRPAYDALTAAWRGAAAGRAPSPLPGAPARAPAERGAGGRSVTVGVSNRHIHIAQEHVARLFGSGASLVPDRPITQPAQFAARERVRVVGPKGAIDGVRIVGPVRGATQVELSASDCRALGVDAPVRHSGHTAGSAAVRLEGPAGAVDLTEGAIVAARHLHVSPADAARFGVTDGDHVTIVLGAGQRRTTLHDVLVRSGKAHATEIHVDIDEASALGLKTGDRATLVGRPTRRPARAAPAARRLITEREVAALGARGESLSAAGPYVLTPAAIDRAKALGLWTGP